MKSQYYKLWSEELKCFMEMRVYGYSGKPCIAFPIQDGRFYDYEDKKLIDSIEDIIQEGKITVFCIDAFEKKVFSSFVDIPQERLINEENFYKYVTTELIMIINEICGDLKPLVLGCSTGAYYATYFYAKRPDLFDSCIALSGIYDSNYFNNIDDEQIIDNSPLQILEELPLDGKTYDLYKSNRIIVGVGSGSFENDCIEQTKKLDFVLKKKELNAIVKYDKSGEIGWNLWNRLVPQFLKIILR